MQEQEGVARGAEVQVGGMGLVEGEVDGRIIVEGWVPKHFVC